MAIETHRNLSRGLELLKLCRGEWLTAREVGGHLKVNEHAALLRLKACEADGFMVSRLRERKAGQRGHRPLEFSVSSAWRND